MTDESKPEDQNQEPTPPAATVADEGGAQGGGDIEALRAENARLSEELAKRSAFADRIKAEEKKERGKRQEGEATIQELSSRLEELSTVNADLASTVETLKPVVQDVIAKNEKAAEDLKARIEQGLPRSVALGIEGKTPLDALETIRAYDEEIAAVSPNGAPRPNAPTNTSPTPPANSAKPDFGALLAAGHKLEHLQAQYGDQWSELVSSGGGASEAPSYMSAVLGAGGGRRKGE